MTKRFILILLGATALLLVLGAGALAGGALAYYGLQSGRLPVAAAARQVPDSGEGVLVARVVPGTAAEQAGLARGDILLAVGEQPVNTPAELMRALQDHEPGSEVALTVRHGDETRTLALQLGEVTGFDTLGIDTCGGYPLALAGKIARIPGAVVFDVVAGSPAEQAGIQVGDIITGLDGQALDGNANLGDLIGGHQPGDEITLAVSRAGEEIQVAVTLSSNPEADGQAYLGIKYSGRPSWPKTDLAPDWQGPDFKYIPADPSGLPFPQGPARRWFDLLDQLPEGAEHVIVAGRVIPGSPADQAGLMRGDVVVAIDGQPVPKDASLAELLSERRPGDVLQLSVFRRGEEQLLAIPVTLGEDPQQPGAAYLGVQLSPALPLKSLRDQTPPVMPFNRFLPGPEFMPAPALPGGDS